MSTESEQTQSSQAATKSRADGITETTEPTPQTVSKIKITTTSIVIQGILLVGFAYLIAWISDHYFGTDYWQTVLKALVPSWQMLGLGLLLTPVYLGFAVSLVYIRTKLTKVSPQTTSNLLEPPSRFGAVVRAIFSGIPEEILNRGVIQSMTGLWLASVIFGALHFSGRKSLLYVASTFAYGLFYGLVFLYSANLWPSIVIHVISNSIGGLQHAQRSRNQRNATADSTQTTTSPTTLSA